MQQATAYTLNVEHKTPITAIEQRLLLLPIIADKQQHNVKNNATTRCHKTFFAKCTTTTYDTIHTFWRKLVQIANINPAHYCILYTGVSRGTVPVC